MKNNRATSKPGGNAIAISRSQIVIYAIVALISLAGLADATYLAVQALTGETMVCGGSPDCFKVLGSPYARIGEFRSLSSVQSLIFVFSVSRFSPPSGTPESAAYYC